MNVSACNPGEGFKVFLTMSNSTTSPQTNETSVSATMVATLVSVIVVAVAVMLCLARRRRRRLENVAAYDEPRHYHDKDKRQLAWHLPPQMIDQTGGIKISWRHGPGGTHVPITLTAEQLHSIPNYPLPEEKTRWIWLTTKTPIYIHNACSAPPRTCQDAGPRPKPHKNAVFVPKGPGDFMIVKEGERECSFDKNFDWINGSRTHIRAL